MTSKRAWEAYPSTYRAREMGILTHWIQAGESGAVVGLAGVGKSNLLGFLCHCSEIVIASPSRGRSIGLAPILVDLNNLPDNDPSTFYRVVLRSLYEARAQLAAVEQSLPTAVQELYRKVEGRTDPFLSQSALREVLGSFKENGARLVLVMDPFDQFCQTAATQVLDTLRGLRDSFKATLSYIVGLRQELAYLRDPVELGELYEILDTHVCRVGPMECEDARWVISQVEDGMGCSFTDEQAGQLIDLTGGYPALLRTASLWLAQASPMPDAAAWKEQLLARPAMQSRLEEMWQGLTGEEQAALSVLCTALSSPSEQERQKSIAQVEGKHRRALDRLQARRLCDETNAGWRIFPLFAAFVAGVERISGGRIWLDAYTDRFFQGDKELTPRGGCAAAGQIRLL